MNTASAPQEPATQAVVGSLHLIRGKIAAGKSTLAQQLAANPHTVLISEDAWLTQL